jgi:hypothetical protein
MIYDKRGTEDFRIDIGEHGTLENLRCGRTAHGQGGAEQRGA